MNFKKMKRVNEVVNEDKINLNRLLSNAPSGEDIFEGKSQTKIATAIANNISNSSYQMIGLEGNWGSGKSNVIKIVEDLLDEESLVFEYNSWEHQGDIQKTTILEDLTEFLKANIKLGKKIIDEKLDEATGKRITSNRTIFPKLNAYMVWYGFILLVTPILCIISNCSESENFIIKNIYCIFPFFAILVGVIVSFFRGLKNKDIAKEMSNMLKIYSDKQESTNSTEFINEKGPSSKLFKEYLNYISKELGNHKKKLVIVFDNMDRLPNSQIVELWSTLHSFFSENTENEHKNIIVIVPFDKSRINIAFDSLMGCSNPDKDNKGNYKYSDDLLNKTFDIIYRVAPPLPSDWKVFFETKWNEIFSDKFSTNIVDEVYDLYDSCDRNISPRNIIGFINKCYVLYNLNKNIPIIYIAMYTVGEKKLLENPEEELISRNFLNLHFQNKYDKDEKAEKFLAALIYQVDPDKAMDVAYQRTLLVALENKDFELVRRIATLSSFSHLLNLNLGKFQNKNKVALTIEEVKDTIQKQQYNDFWFDWMLIEKEKDESYKELQVYEQKILLNVVLKNDLEDIKRGVDDNWRFYFNKLARTIKSRYDGDSKLDEANLLSYVEDITKLLKIRKNRSQLDFIPNILPLSLEKEVELFFEVSKNTQGIPINEYNIKIDKVALSTYLGDSKNLLEKIPSTKILTFIEKSGFSIEAFKEMITLNFYNITNSDIYREVVKRQFELYDKFELIENFNNYQIIKNLMTKYKTYEDCDSIAIYLTSMIIFTACKNKKIDNLIGLPIFIVKIENEAIENKITEALFQISNFADYFVNGLLMFASNYEIVPKVINHWMNLIKDEKDIIINIPEILQNWDKFTILKNIDTEILNSTLETKYIQQESEIELNLDEIPNSFVNFLLVESNLLKIRKKVIKKFKSLIGDISKEKWMVLLQTQKIEDCNALSYGILIGNEWNSSFISAFQSVIIQNTFNYSDNSKEEIGKLINSLLENEKSTLFSEIINDNDFSFDVTNFEYLADYFFEYIKTDILNSRIDKFITDKIVCNSKCLDIIKNNIEKFRNAFFMNEETSQEGSLYQKRLFENPDAKEIVRLLDINEPKLLNT